MGCDIHLYVERKNSEGNWEVVRGKNPRINNYRDWAKSAREQGDNERALTFEKEAEEIESGAMLAGAEDEWDKEYNSPQVLEGWLYNGRSYNLFAILADVRNGRGFAGMYTGEGFNPISEPKGLPDDVSVEIKAESDRWDCDGHSHSWLSLKELVEYDWEQKAKVLKAGYYDINTPVDELKNNTEEYLYKDCAGKFYTDAIPQLRELANNDLESVRIVFWFDN